MIVLRITIVLDFFLIKDAMFTKQIKPQLLEMSLKQVNQILDDIDRKIGMEMNLLTKLNKENVQEYRRAALSKYFLTSKKPAYATHNLKQTKMKTATTNKQYKVTSKQTNKSTHQESKGNIEFEVKGPESKNKKKRDDVTISKASANLSVILQQIFPENGVIPFIDRKLILRRRMRKNSKNIAKYNKLIRHFILKHSTLFHTFIKHYEKSQKHSHHSFRHHEKHKRSHKSSYRHKGNVRQAVDPNSKEGVENSLVNKMVKTEGLPKSDDDLVEQAVIPYPDKKEKRQRAEYLEHCSENDTSIKFKKLTTNNTKNFGSFTKNGYIKTQNWVQFLTTTKNLILKNKSLTKIVEESSYSDEELYLKTMLKDAFFHGNATLPGNLPKR